MNFAPFNEKPPYYKKNHEAFVDKGNGIPTLKQNNLKKATRGAATPRV